MKPKKISRDLLSVARELLDLQCKQDKWNDKVYAAGIELNEPISGSWLLLHLALDILGYPKDNTEETNACEIANETGKWPEGAFSRDGIVHAYRVMVVKDGNLNGFIEVATGRRDMPSDIHERHAF